MRVRATAVAVGNQRVLHIGSVCFYPYVSGTQCACTILSSVAFHCLQYFPTLSHKRPDFQKKKRMCGTQQRVLISCTTFVRNDSHSKKN